jgi:acylphosphatase
MTSAVQRFRAIIRGRVQGVGFRATAMDEARRLQLAGWVRNRLDGTVEVDAEGPDEDCRALLAFLRQGPRGARVLGVDVEWQPALGATPPFQMRNTE